MNAKHLIVPLFLAGAFLIGCDKTKSPSADVNAAETKAAVDKNAADAKATAEKAAAEKTATEDKAKADAKAASDKVAADKAAADTLDKQSSKLLADLKTDIADKKWADAGVIVKELDAVRDRLPAGEAASFDSLKKQYDDKKQ
jgi:membrane protein involved in colicin uptake